MQQVTLNHNRNLSNKIQNNTEQEQDLEDKPKPVKLI